MSTVATKKKRANRPEPPPASRRRRAADEAPASGVQTRRRAARAAEDSTAADAPIPFRPTPVPAAPIERTPEIPRDQLSTLPRFIADVRKRIGASDVDLENEIDVEIAVATTLGLLEQRLRIDPTDECQRFPTVRNLAALGLMPHRVFAMHQHMGIPAKGLSGEVLWNRSARLLFEALGLQVWLATQDLVVDETTLAKAGDVYAVALDSGDEVTRWIASLDEADGTIAVDVLDKMGEDWSEYERFQFRDDLCAKGCAL